MVLKRESRGFHFPLWICGRENFSTFRLFRAKKSFTVSALFEFVKKVLHLCANSIKRRV
jgi:hypothetical protein